LVVDLQLLIHLLGVKTLRIEEKGVGTTITQQNPGSSNDAAKSSNRDASRGMSQRASIDTGMHTFMLTSTSNSRSGPPSPWPRPVVLPGRGEKG
jgi:hypothetical protein